MTNGGDNVLYDEPQSRSYFDMAETIPPTILVFLE